MHAIPSPSRLHLLLGHKRRFVSVLVLVVRVCVLIATRESRSFVCPTQASSRLPEVIPSKSSRSYTHTHALTHLTRDNSLHANHAIYLHTSL